MVSVQVFYLEDFETTYWLYVSLYVSQVVMRLKLITELNEQLAKCLAKHTSYVPFPANFELERSALVPKSGSKPAATDKRKGTKGSKGKKEKKKEGATIDETLVDSTQDGEEETDLTLTQSLADADSSKVNKTGGSDSLGNSSCDLSVYRHCFRELDISVFTILKIGLSSKWRCVPGSVGAPSPEKDRVSLDLPELKFLLEDLSAKLRHALELSGASAGRRIGFAKGDNSRRIGFSNLDHHSATEVAKQVASLFPTLCELVEEAANFFQAQVRTVVI